MGGEVSMPTQKLEKLLQEAKEIGLEVEIFRNGLRVSVACYPEASSNPVRAKKLAEEIADEATAFYRTQLGA
jgi:hypothetical protein